jgi:hypothetical protein
LREGDIEIESERNRLKESEREREQGSERDRVVGVCEREGAK